MYNTSMASMLFRIFGGLFMIMAAWSYGSSEGWNIVALLFLLLSGGIFLGGFAEFL